MRGLFVYMNRRVNCLVAVVDLTHDALFFALPFAFFFGVAFVVLRFTARQCDFTFDFAVFVM